jgi:hypothetical protein
VAWAPGDRRTVVRASGGVYFDRIPLRATSNALQRDGIRYKTAVLAPTQQRAGIQVLAAFPDTLLTAITSMDPHIQSGRSRQFGLQVERGLGSKASATVGYSWLRGDDIIMSRNINPPTLTPAQAALLGIPNLGRPNPAFGNISQFQSIGDSWYDGLTLALSTWNASWGRTRVSRCRSRSTSGNAFFRRRRTTPTSRRRRPSDNDQQHRLVVAAFRRQERHCHRALAGMQLSYVWPAPPATFNVVAGSDLFATRRTTTGRPASAGAAAAGAGDSTRHPPVADGTPAAFIASGDGRGVQRAEPRQHPA